MRRHLHRGIGFVIVVVASLSIGVVVARWDAEAAGTIQAATGDVALEVDGDLAFESAGCSSEIHATPCEKFDSDVVGIAPLSHSTGGASFTITGWVHKEGEPSETVGFYYTVTGGTVALSVKSGRGYHEASLAEGSGLWLNPACEGDPGPGKGVVCNPKNAKAISFVGFCLEVTAPPVCPPMMGSLDASNGGSIPFRFEMWLIGPHTGTDYCGRLDLTIRRVLGGTSTDPPLYQGPMCGLVGSSVPLEAHLDPGASVRYELTLSPSESTSSLDGTNGGFVARFQATQWNESQGWTDFVDIPLTISVAGVPAESVGSEPPPRVDPDEDSAQEVEAPVDEEPANDESSDPPSEPPDDEPPTATDTAGLTGIVWLDQNTDGVRADVEPRLAGVAVYLLGDGVEVGSTTTGLDGSYSFSNLAVGNYTLVIEAPSSHAFTPPGLGENPALDSDVVEVIEANGGHVGQLNLSLGPGVATGIGDAGLIINAGGEGG